MESWVGEPVISPDALFGKHSSEEGSEAAGAEAVSEGEGNEA